jgi:hypothetical protein
MRQNRDHQTDFSAALGKYILERNVVSVFARIPTSDGKTQITDYNNYASAPTLRLPSRAGTTLDLKGLRFAQKPITQPRWENTLNGGQFPLLKPDYPAALGQHFCAASMDLSRYRLPSRAGKTPEHNRSTKSSSPITQSRQDNSLTS